MVWLVHPNIRQDRIRIVGTLSLHAQMFALQLRLGGPRDLTVDYVPLLRLCSVTFLDGCQLKVLFNVFHKGRRYSDKMPNQQEVSNASKYKCFLQTDKERRACATSWTQVASALTEHWVGNTDSHTAIETCPTCTRDHPGPFRHVPTVATRRLFGIESQDERALNDLLYSTAYLICKREKTCAKSYKIVQAL